MFQRLSAWRSEIRDAVLYLEAPEGPEAGAIRCIERQRPVERLGDLLRRHGGGPFTDAAVHGSPERLVTDEGEHATLVTIGVRVDGARALRVLGFVFGDEWYDYVGGIVFRPEHEARLAVAVRTLVVGDKLQLGLRRRRYLYEAPVGWQALTEGALRARHVPLDHPSNPTCITVYPAIPVPHGTTPTVDLQRLPGEDLLCAEPGPPTGFKVLIPTEKREVARQGGLRGNRYRLFGRWPETGPLVRDIVLLRDDRYAYTAELRTDVAHREEATARFERLWRSIEPVPGGPGVRSTTSNAFSHFGE